MDSNNRRIVQTYKSLVLQQNIPDDLITIILDYTGNMMETKEDVINNNCFYKVINTSDMMKKAWFFNGHLCTVCQQYLCIKNASKLKSHCNNKTHKKKMLKYFNKRKIEYQYKKYKKMKFDTPWNAKRVLDYPVISNIFNKYKDKSFNEMYIEYLYLTSINKGLNFSGFHNNDNKAISEVVKFILVKDF